jgi:hypothetical protein
VWLIKCSIKKLLLFFVILSREQKGIAFVIYSTCADCHVRHRPRAPMTTCCVGHMWYRSRVLTTTWACTNNNVCVHTRLCASNIGHNFYACGYGCTWLWSQIHAHVIIDAHGRCRSWPLVHIADTEYDHQCMWSAPHVIVAPAAVPEGTCGRGQTWPRLLYKTII